MDDNERLLEILKQLTDLKNANEKLKELIDNSKESIYVFYHIYCNKNTVDVVKDQCFRIVFSGLYKRVDAVYCFLVGEPDYIAKVKDMFKAIGSKFVVGAEGPGDTSYERFTLLKIPAYLKPNDKFLYIHSKGVSDINYYSGKPPERENIYWWRTWMEYFLVGEFNNCLEALKTHDIVGVNYSSLQIGPHFSGNFWWSTAKYYTSLRGQIPHHYFCPEQYIFSGSPRYLDIDAGRMKENKGLYSEPFYSTKYIDLPVSQPILRRYTAIIVEPRKHMALGFVLNNILTNLNSEWGIQIHHGTRNSNWVEDLIISELGEFRERIELKNLGVENLENSQEYSKILTNRNFIEKIPTETFLVFQTDSMINPAYKDLWKKFEEYDYVGAPWPWEWLKVGNGGFSLRKKSVMLKIIDLFGPYTGLYEDHFYSHGCDRIGAKKPTVEQAKEFSIEQIYNPYSFGIHKAWLHQPTRVEELCKQCEGLETLIKLQKCEE